MTTDKKKCVYKDERDAEARAIAGNKAKLQASSLRLGDADTDYTTTNARDFDRKLITPRDRSVADHKADHMKSSVPFEGASTYKIDYIKKGGQVGSRGVPSIDPWGTNLPKPELTDKEWAEQLVSTKTEAYVKYPINTRSIKDPKLQESHISIGRGDTDYGTTSGSMLVAHGPQSRAAPLRTKAELQKTSIPTGDTQAWKDDLVSSSQEHFVARPLDRGVRGSQDFFRNSSVHIGKDGKLATNTTNRDDYTEKHGPGYERARATIDPHSTSIPRGTLPESEWHKDNAKSLSAESYDGRQGPRAQPFDPNLQGSHIRLGDDPLSYETTTRQVFTTRQMRPEDRPVLAKPDLQRSSIRENEETVYQSTTREAFQARPGEGYKAQSMREFHRTSNVALASDKKGIWDTTHHVDYTPKKAGVDRGAPLDDPRAVHITMGHDKTNYFTSTHGADFVPPPASRSAAAKLDTRVSHIRLGDDKVDYASVQALAMKDRRRVCCSKEPDEEHTH